MRDYQPIKGTSQRCSEEETIKQVRAILMEGVTFDDPPQRALLPFGPRKTDEPRKTEETKRRTDDLPEVEQASEPTPSPVPTRRFGQFRVVHAVFLIAVAVAVLAPGLLLFSAFIVPLVALLLFLGIGPARIVSVILARIKRVAAKDPQRAAEMRARLDRFACVWEGILDRLPESMVDHLYLPHIADTPDPGQWHDQAMAERVARYT